MLTALKEGETYRLVEVVSVVVFVLIVIAILLGREKRIWRGGGDPPQHWPTTEGKVFVSRVREVKDGEGGIHYGPDIQCAYSVDGISYTTAPSCARSGLVLSRGDAEGAIGEYPVGMAVTVRYDPQNPQRAVVEDWRVTPPLWRRVWQFQLDGVDHTVDLKHGVISGRVTVHLDGKLLQRSSTLFRPAGDYTFAIGGHKCVVRVRPCIINYRHRLLVDGRPVKPVATRGGLA
jgi:hypothetical protein